MSHQLQWEITLLLDRWHDTYREDATRLRFYQRELAKTRQLPVRPHASIVLLLRQCAAARKMKAHAQNTIQGCRSRIQLLSGTTPQ
ncbi:hypothetical protein D3C79_589330 [compost metagenome]